MNYVRAWYRKDTVKHISVHDAWGAGEIPWAIGLYLRNPDAVLDLTDLIWIDRSGRELERAIANNLITWGPKYLNMISLYGRHAGKTIKNQDILLIDVYKMPSNTWIYRGYDSEDVVTFKDHSMVGSIPVGTGAIVGEDTWKSRWSRMTSAILGDNFPWKNVIVAGGSISKTISSSTNADLAKASDLDVFIVAIDPEEHENIVKELVNWFKIKGADWWVVMASVVTVYFTAEQRTVQIISSRYKNAYEVLNRFDLSHIMWGVVGDSKGNPKVVCHYSAVAAAATGVSVANCKLRLVRLAKAAMVGYSVKMIPQDPIRKIPLASLSDKIRAEKATVTGTWYWPTDADDNHNEVMLRKIVPMKSATITRDGDKVLEKMVIGGSFSEYVAVLARQDPFTMFVSGDYVVGVDNIKNNTLQCWAREVMPTHIRDQVLVEWEPVDDAIDNISKWCILNKYFIDHVVTVTDDVELRTQSGKYMRCNEIRRGGKLQITCKFKIVDKTVNMVPIRIVVLAS